MQRSFPTFLLILVLLCACTTRSVNTLEPTSLPSTMQEAHAVLVEFFTRLNTKDYSAAVDLYGGGYETLQAWNPDIDPSDHVQLWAHACEWNGLQCLPARTVIFKQMQGDSYVFQVEFSNPDGSLFVLGPCCGANETEMPPVSRFDYTVSRNADMKFVVMDTPPYVP